MIEDFRHHHAVRVIFVETPVAGSPKPVDARRPPAYPHQKRDRWLPRTKPPNKAEVLRRFLDRTSQQDNEVRAFLDAARAASHRCDEMIPSV
jgi:hypothetical protein